jgi:CBS domain containing-hemolysin-like protein
VLTAILIGNNLVNMLAAALASRLSEDVFHEHFSMAPESSTALAVAVGGMTLLILIFGEIFPKTYAKHNADKFIRLGPILVAFYYLVYPITGIFVWMSRGIAHLTGAKINKDGPMVRIEDIEHMVRIGAEHDSLDRDEARYLSGVLELDDRVAREIMVPRTDMSALDTTTTLPTVLEHMKEERYSRYPVYRDQIDEIVGVLYVKDLLDVLGTEASDSFVLEEIMRPPVFVPETRSVADLLKSFRKEKVHIAIVVDEFGGTAGLVTLEDVIEEIVGEIYDEYDEEDNFIQPISDRAFSLDGASNLRDVEQALDISFPESEEYESIAGFLVSEAGDLPAIDYELAFEGYRFIVKEADERRVIRVEAHRVDKEPDQEDVA